MSVVLYATPHNGKACSFASLTNELDPTVISDPEVYAKGDHCTNGLVIRRFGKDIHNQVQQEFTEQVVNDIHLEAPLEEVVSQALLDVPFTCHREHSPDPGAERNGQLVRIGLQQTLFNSPTTAQVSVGQRTKRLHAKAETSKDEQGDIQAPYSLSLALLSIDTSHFNRRQQSLKLLNRNECGRNTSNTDNSLVIFSECIEARSWLHG